MAQALDWIVFDEESAAAARALAGAENLQVRARSSEQNALGWALGRGADSVVLMPGATPGRVLLARVRMPQPAVETAVVEATPRAASFATSAMAPQPVAQKTETMPPATSWMATGILGLEGEAEYLDEVQPKRGWWESLFSRKK